MTASVMAVNGGYDADVGSAFVSSPTGQGALISDRVILTVGHVYPTADGVSTYRTSGKIRDPIRNAADVGEQSWTGTAIQHPKYDTCQQYEITMIILDTPLANLCAGPNTPYALELPFDVSTGTPTVPGYYGCLNCGSSVTECRSYGYGAYDSNRLHYATQQRMNGGNNIQSADACTDYVKYVGFNKTRGNLCNGDSGGPNICLYNGKWRLVSLSKGVSAGCDSATQQVYGTDLQDPKIKQWIRDTLTQRNALQSVIDAKTKCANVAQPIEGAAPPPPPPPPPPPSSQSCETSMFWAEWGAWGTCYPADNIMVQNRFRDCTSNLPECENEWYCGGESSEERPCSTGR